MVLWDQGFLCWPHRVLQNIKFRFYKEKQLHYLRVQGAIQAASGGEITVEVCAPHGCLSLLLALRTDDLCASFDRLGVCSPLSLCMRLCLMCRDLLWHHLISCC